MSSKATSSTSARQEPRERVPRPTIQDVPLDDFAMPVSRHTGMLVLSSGEGGDDVRSEERMTSASIARKETLDALEGMIDEAPYLTPQMRGVAARSFRSRSAIYKYFSDVEVMIRRLAERWADEIFADVEGDPLAMCERSTAWMQEYPHRARFLARESVRGRRDGALLVILVMFAPLEDYARAVAAINGDDAAATFAKVTYEVKAVCAELAYGEEWPKFSEESAALEQAGAPISTLPLMIGTPIHSRLLA